MSNEVEERIDKESKRIQERLSHGLNDEGKIDLDKLRKVDPDLTHALEAFAASKTARDDPQTSARDFAKLLEARSNQTDLGRALDSLANNQND